MTTTQFTCPLCGHQFDPAAHLACQTCPLHRGCRLVCCPTCGHTTVDQAQSQLVRWIRSFLDRSPTQPDSQRGIAPDQGQCGVSPRVLADVPLNCRARVTDVSGLPTAQREQLHGYGISPGCVLRVVQRAPVTVVRVEHTELGIESQVARAIQVDQVA